jgi:rhodanese-related sulfurtransferase/peroxiredoxin
MSIKNFFLRFLIHRPLQQGSAVPYLSLTAHDGTWIRSEDLQDTTLYVLFFFTSFSDKAVDEYLDTIEILHQKIQSLYQNKKTEDTKKTRRDKSEKEISVKIYGVTDQNITILRKEIETRGLTFPLLYDPFAIESRRFGLSKRRFRCAYGHVIVDQNGICLEHQRGSINGDDLFEKISSILSMKEEKRTSKIQGNNSSDELLVGVVDSGTAESKIAKESYRIIDVRTFPEYEADHIPNAIHIPLDDLHNRHAELDPLKELLFVCQTGSRATTAAEFVTSIGGQYIFVIQGGMSEWNGDRLTGGKR